MKDIKISNLGTGIAPLKSKQLAAGEKVLPSKTKAFSARLKEVIAGDWSERSDFTKPYEPGDAVLNPVKPRLEVQSDVRRPVSDSDAFSSDQTAKASVKPAGNREQTSKEAEGTLSKPAKPENAVSQNNDKTNPLQNSSSNKENNPTAIKEAVGEKSLNPQEEAVDGSKQSLLLQKLKSLYPGLSIISTDSAEEQISAKNIQAGENQGIDAVYANPQTAAAIDLTGSTYYANKDSAQTSENQNNGFVYPIPQSSAEAAAKLADNAPHTNNEENIPTDSNQADRVYVDPEIHTTTFMPIFYKGKTSVDENADNAEKSENGLFSGSQNVSNAYQGQLYSGSLSDLISRGELVFGDVTLLQINAKGIYIGDETDPEGLNNSLNYVDGDFLKKVFEKLSKDLQNADEPSVSEQLRSMLAQAIKNAASNMHDPEKQEQEYQEKVLNFLFKFIDRITGNDENKDDKKTALEDGKKDKGDLLLQLVENLIEASQKNESKDTEDSDKTDGTLAIYVTAFGISIMQVDAKENLQDSSQPVSMAAEYVQTSAEQAVNLSEINAYSKDNANLLEHTVVFNSQTTKAADISDVQATKTVDVSDTQTVKENENVINAANIKTTADYKPQQIVSEKTENAQNIENIESAAIQATAYEAVKSNPRELKIDVQTASQSDLEKVNADIPQIGRFKNKIMGASKELDELKRLFGIKDNTDHTEERIKQSNEISEAAENNADNNSQSGTARSKAVENVKGEAQNVKSAEDLDKEGNFKDILESVSVENIKIDAPAARSFVSGENSTKQIISQIISEMLNNLSNMPKLERAVTTVTMTLNPESLGKITMKVAQEAGKVSLMITAHNRDTAELLSQKMEAVQQAAKDSGTQLEKYQVVYAPQQDERAGQHQSFDGSSKNPYVRQNDEENTDKDGKFAELLKQAI